MMVAPRSAGIVTGIGSCHAGAVISARLLANNSLVREPVQLYDVVHVVEMLILQTGQQPCL
jgi:hypothetical protein